MNDIMKRLVAIDGLTFADCVRFFDERATERERAIAELAATREGEVEVDNAIVSESDDNGAYVLAWLWVDFAGTAFDKDNDEDDNGDN